MIDTQAYIKFMDLINELDKEQLKELVDLINEYLRVEEERENGYDSLEKGGAALSEQTTTL